MDIATGAMNALLSKLGELLVDEYNLQKGVKKKIEKLQKELIYMNTALLKVSEVPVDQLDELNKIWARDVRELSYDIEDTVDTFMVNGKKRKRTEPRSSFMAFVDKAKNLWEEFKTNHETHKIFKDIMSQVEEAKERHDRYNVHSVASKPEAVTYDPRIEAMFRKSTELVGIGESKNELAKRLMEEDGSSGQETKIISIVGFGGLGKTTLAKALFDEFKAEFDCHFFVSVSLKPNIMNIFKNILDQLDKQKYAHIDAAWDDMRLTNEIRGFIENKRCLCVIDDIWEERAWDNINRALKDGNCGSKIIVTTRKKAVAERACGYVYELKPLSHDCSKELLNMRVFGSKDRCLADLTQVAVKILKKCGGVPLAIITTASLLANKPMHQQEWEKVSKSIGVGMEKCLDVDNMSKILSLSYYDLPPHLKTCLLYLSIYPEDKVIERDVLVSSWIAEGFITNEGQAAGARLQEVGDSYFNELINRSLIQQVDVFNREDQDGQVHACRVHDMVLELLNQLSAEEGFVTTLFSDGPQAAGTSSVQKKKIRRLSLHNSSNSFASPEARDERLSKVRSLTVFDGVDSIPPLSSFPVLRLLQLEHCYRLKNNLKDLGNLSLLRFLRLYRIAEIPESIGNLQFLHTLDVTAADYRQVQLPKSFVNLGRLVRLVGSVVRLPHGVTLENMKSLQEVVGIWVVSEYEMQQIGTLTELRVLHIVLDGDALYDGNFWEALQSWNKLQDLVIGVSDSAAPGPVDFNGGVPSGLQRFYSEIAFKPFPGWINSSLSSLTTLDICLHTCIRKEYLDTLSELPSLRFLSLLALYDEDDDPEERIINIAAYAFRCLQHLHVRIDHMGLKFQPGAMPKLQRLRFDFHASGTKHFYGGFDFGLENLPSLRHVSFYIEGYDDDKLEAEAAVRKALNDNPNHPSFKFIR